MPLQENNKIRSVSPDYRFRPFTTHLSTKVKWKNELANAVFASTPSLLQMSRDRKVVVVWRKNTFTLGITSSHCHTTDDSVVTVVSGGLNKRTVCRRSVSPSRAFEATGKWLTTATLQPKTDNFKIGKNQQFASLAPFHLALI